MTSERVPTAEELVERIEAEIDMQVKNIAAHTEDIETSRRSIRSARERIAELNRMRPRKPRKKTNGA